MTTAVITDSAASVPSDLVRELGITVVPLEIVVDQVSYHDGELPVSELVTHIGDGVSTSGPPPGRIGKAFEDRLRDADALVMMTVSQRMSSTYDAACLAAGTVAGDVRIVDTETAAGAEGLVVEHAARGARRGDGADAVERAARTVAERVRLVATLDSLDSLVASGRVPELAGRAGRFLNVHPLFEFRGGRVRALRPALSRDAALDRIASAWRRNAERDARLHVAVLHANDPGRAERLLAQVQEEVEPASAFVAEFSAAMLAHTGPELVGLAWWWEPAQ
jgi:DegV family protein with EDD domain